MTLHDLEVYFVADISKYILIEVGKPQPLPTDDITDKCIRTDYVTDIVSDIIGALLLVCDVIDGRGLGFVGLDQNVLTPLCYVSDNLSVDFELIRFVLKIINTYMIKSILCKFGSNCMKLTSKNSFWIVRQKMHVFPSCNVIKIQIV